MKRLLAFGALFLCALLASSASAEWLSFGNLKVHVDGGFTPRTLPRKSYAPIEFKGYATLEPVGGRLPPALQQAVINFDRDGKLDTKGLATCNPSLLEEATPQEARERCPHAIVGTGHVGALIETQGGPLLHAGSELTVFNGPRQEGHPTAILHARTTVPAVQNFVITVPIERRSGAFRYRVTIDVPPIAAGRGALVHIDGHIGRRFRFGGRLHSYVSARCSHHVLSTYGRFTFSEETFIEGSLEKSCTPR